jgi:hypothetical protein
LDYPEPCGSLRRSLVFQVWLLPFGWTKLRGSQPPL